jgi:hypothetical protein
MERLNQYLPTTYMLALLNDINKIIIISCIKTKNTDGNKTNDFYHEYSLIGAFKGRWNVSSRSIAEYIVLPAMEKLTVRGMK